MKTTSLLASAVAATSILASACATDVGDSVPERTTIAALSPTAARAMPLPAARPDGRAHGSVSGNLTYHGGPIISNVKVWTVFWNSRVPDQSELNSFYSTITSSAAVSWLNEYDTPTQKFGLGSLAGSIVDSGAPKATSLHDSQIQEELTRLIDSGALPAPDADTLYMIHFPAGVSITMQSYRSCQQFCAYHGTYERQGAKVFYGVMPDMSGGCAACGGGGSKFENTTIISSHELIEAMTDPAVGLADQSSSMLGWYDDDNNQEISDLCQGGNTRVAGYMVQNEWSNQEGACIGVRSGGGDTGGGAGGSGGAGGGDTSEPEDPCPHKVCATGAKLTPTCGPCTEKICAADPHCCGTTWDASCVAKVVTVCHKHC